MEEDKNGDSKELTCQKNRTIVISKDNNCQKPQMNIPEIKSLLENQQPLRVYIDLDSFDDQTAFSIETLEALKSAENVELFVGTRSILKKHKNNTQSAFLDCLAFLIEHLKILRIVSEAFTYQISFALFGITLSRFKGLQVLSLDFFGSDSFMTELNKIFESIGNSMSDLKELEIKMKRSSSSYQNLLQPLGLAINQLQRLNKLQISVYSEFPFVEKGISKLFNGIKSARGLTDLAIDIRATLRGEDLLSCQRMLRELKNLQKLKLNIQTSTDVEYNCIKKFISAIFSLTQLKYLELETKPLGDLNQHDIEDLVKDNFHKLNSLEGIQLRVFDFNRIENQFSSLSIFTNISQENNLKKLKKLDLNISRNQKLPKPRIADVIRQFDSLEELTLIVERGYYGWLQEQGNQEMELFNNSQEIQENKLDDENGILFVEDPSETVQELLNSIGSQKKIRKLDLQFETGNLIRNQGWEALSNLKELSDLCIKVGDNSGLSDTYLAAVTKCLFLVRNLQFFSLTIGSFQSTSEKGWNMLFRAVGKLTELQGMYLWIETHNEVNDCSVYVLASSIQLLRNLESLEIIFGSNNISIPATFLQLISSVQFLSKLKTLSLVDMASRRTISEKTHQQTQMAQQTQNDQNKGFNIINLSLRRLHNLENLKIYFETGQLADLDFSKYLQLCGTISDLEDLKELDIKISGKFQVIGVMSSIQKKQLAEYLQSQNTKQIQNPNTNTRVFFENQARYKSASQEQEELVLTTANGICFVIKNNITNNNSADTISSVGFGHSWQFPQDTAKLKLNFLGSSEYPQIEHKISCLTTGLWNLQICRKISISLKSTIPHVLPQQSFDSLIQSICAMTNLTSIDLQLSTSSLTEETSQNLQILQLHLAKAKLHFTFDFPNSTQAVITLIQSFILNANIQKLDIKCYDFFKIFLQKKLNPQKIEDLKLIKPLSPNTETMELKSPSTPSYWTSLEIIAPNDLLILPQNDNDISNSFESFIHSKYIDCISHIGSFLNYPGVTDKFDKLFINLSSKDLQGIQDDQTVHQLFQGIKAQSTLKHLSLIASNGLVFNSKQILNISETISLMSNLQILDLQLKSDNSFTAIQALNVMTDLQSIDNSACTIKSPLITLRTSKYQQQIDSPILAIQPMNFTISREKNSTNNFEGNDETHNNNSFPLLCLQLSELFNWFNYLLTPLTSIFIDTNYFLSSNEQNASQNFNNFKHLDSLKKLTMLVNYQQMNTDIKQLFSMFENSNVLESLVISITEFMQPSSIRNSGTLLGEELRHLKNLKSLSLKVSNYSFQNDDLRELCLSLRDMSRLNFLNIQTCLYASLSIDALTNLVYAIGDLQELEALSFCLSVEKSIPSETCLRVLNFLSQSAQGAELNVRRKRSIAVNIVGYFSYRYNSFMLRPCSQSTVQIQSNSQRNYEISLPVSSSDEKEDLEILVNSIMEVFTEQEGTIIQKLGINLKNDEQFLITTDFLNVLVVFLRKTGKKLSHLSLQIKDLYDNQLQEICNILQIQTNKTQNYSALHTETVSILVDLPGEFDSYERFLNHLYQYLESTTTLRLSLDLPRDGLERLRKLAKRRMKRLVRLQQNNYQFY